MKVTRVVRGLDSFMIPFPSLVLKAGDHLIIRDTPARLKEFEKVLEGKLFNDFLRVAVPMVLIMWVTLSWLLPTLYGIQTN